MLFLIYLPIYTLAVWLAYPLVPLAVWLADGDGRLPFLFRWLETHDNLGWKGPLSEPDVRATYEKYGPKIGLIRWLWRNKAYTLRYWMRAKIKDGMVRKERGVLGGTHWGFSYWLGSVGPYWELQPTLGLGKYKLFMRIGWKMTPYFKEVSPKNLSAGIFTGISIRSDDREG